MIDPVHVSEASYDVPGLQPSLIRRAIGHHAVYLGKWRPDHFSI